MERTHLFVALNSLIGAMIVFLAINTLILRVLYSFLFFWLMLFLQLLLFNFKCPLNSSFLRSMKIRGSLPFALMVIVALVASASLIGLSPARIEVDQSAMYISFVELSYSDSLRIISGYFLASVFPGYIAYKNLISRKYSLDPLERICLALALSYCFTVIDGLVLLQTVGLSVLSFTASIWVFTALTALIDQYVLQKDENVQTVSGATKEGNGFSYLLILTTSIIILFSSYIMVLTTGPFAGALSGDASRYGASANEFMNYSSTMEPYIWLQTYVSIISSITGLPFLYGYVLLQYYNLLVPLSFYLLIRTVYPKSARVASIGAVMVSLIQGMSALGFWWALRTPDSFNGYFGNSSYDVLNNSLFSRIGSGATPVLLFLSNTIDVALLLIATCFMYSYLKQKKRSISALILGTFFITVVLFTHNITSPIALVATVFIFGLCQRKPGRAFLATFSFILVFFVLLDSLSKFWFSTSVLLSYFISMVSATSSSSVAVVRILFLLIVLAVIAAAVLVGPVITAKLGRNKKLGSCKSKFLRLLNRNNSRRFLLILALFIFVISVCFCFLNYDTTDVTRAWSETYIFPWFVFVFRYGFALFLTIGLLPLIVKKHSSSIFFILSWLLSFISVAAITFVMNLEPQILTNRYLLFVFIPLSCLAALAIDALSEKGLPKGNRSMRKYLVASSLICMMSISFVSYCYVTELFYLAPSQGITSPVQESVNWMNNNLPPGSVVFPTSENTYNVLCALTMAKVLPMMKWFSPSAPYSWLHDILTSTYSPEDALYILQSLGVSYVYVSNSDIPSIAGTGFTSMLNNLSEVYNNGEIRILNVPPNDGYEPPYPKELFNFIIPSLSTLWSLEGLHGQVIYYSDVELQGAIAVSSDQVKLEYETLSIQGLVFTTENGTQSFNDTVIYNTEIEGRGSITSSSCVISSNHSISDVSSVVFSPLNLSLTNATITFKLNDTTIIGPYYDSAVSLTAVGNLNITLKEPTITVAAGTAKGVIEGSFFYGNLFFYSMTKNNFSFSGDFRFSIEWASGPILAKIYDINQMEISPA